MVAEQVEKSVVMQQQEEEEEEQQWMTKWKTEQQESMSQSNELTRSEEPEPVEKNPNEKMKEETRRRFQ